MSVERMGNGALRLACDGDEFCERKFSPRRPFASARALRDHAISYGWLTEPVAQQQPPIPGIGEPGPPRDICPECRRTRR